MSEQQAEATHGEPGSVSAGSTISSSSEMPSEAAAAADLAVSVLQAPAVAPDHEAPPKEEVKHDAEVEAPRIEVPKQDAPRGTGKVLIMAPGDRSWRDHNADVNVETEGPSSAAPESGVKTNPESKRSFPAMAAMLALATIAGAIGGALATTGLPHVADAAATTPGSSALEASIARIDSDVLALKAGLDHTTKTSLSQFTKTSDRLDRIEKAQAEPNAKLAKLTEAVDKLRAEPHSGPVPAQVAAVPAQVAAVPAAASKEVTGSVTPPPVPVAAPAQAS